MLNSTILDEIKKFSNSTKIKDYQNIARHILAHWKNFKNQNIQSIANACSISPTKVNRFCKKLNLNGFSELKIRIQDLKNLVTIDGNVVNVIKDIKDHNNLFFEKYHQIQNSSSRNQLNYFLNKDHSYVINKIINAKRIFIFGFNLSFNISRNFSQRLRWLNKTTIHESDLISIDTYLDNIDKKDLVILISISGKNQYIQQLAKSLFMKTNIFAIVDKNCNFLSYLNDYYLINTDEDKLWAINSIRAQLVIQTLDFIYAKLIQNK